jgi:hypothetical protein
MMGTEIKVWDVTTGDPSFIDEGDQNHLLEQELETWISKVPRILGDNLRWDMCYSIAI